VEKEKKFKVARFHTFSDSSPVIKKTFHSSHFTDTRTRCESSCSVQSSSESTTHLIDHFLSWNFFSHLLLRYEWGRKNFFLFLLVTKKNTTTNTKKLKLRRRYSELYAEKLFAALGLEVKWRFARRCSWNLKLIFHFSPLAELVFPFTSRLCFARSCALL
jgi:hypothetical protein